MFPVPISSFTEQEGSVSKDFLNENPASSVFEWEQPSKLSWLLAPTEATVKSSQEGHPISMSQRDYAGGNVVWLIPFSTCPGRTFANVWHHTAYKYFLAELVEYSFSNTRQMIRCKGLSLANLWIVWKFNETAHLYLEVHICLKHIIWFRFRGEVYLTMGYLPDWWLVYAAVTQPFVKWITFQCFTNTFILMEAYVIIA